MRIGQREGEGWAQELEGPLALASSENLDHNRGMRCLGGVPGSAEAAMGVACEVRSPRSPRSYVGWRRENAGTRR
jgi:hypothetical protein